MSYEFKVEKNDAGGYDLFIRDSVSMEDFKTIKEFPIFHKKTECGATLDMCKTYIFEYLTEGSIVAMEDATFIVPKRVRGVQ